jgi:hypothetical protein
MQIFEKPGQPRIYSYKDIQLQRFALDREWVCFLTTLKSKAFKKQTVVDAIENRCMILEQYLLN